MPVKEEKTLRKLPVKLLLISLGFAVAGLGTALMYRADLGSRPNATMSDGLHKILGISYGAGNLMSNILTLLLVLAAEKRLIGYGTLVCVFTMGIYIDFWSGILPQIPGDMGVAVRLLAALAGDIIMAAGLAFYVKIQAGLGPLEAIAEILQKKLKCSYRIAKTAEDGAVLVAGIALGGTFGPGTVLSVCFTGFFMQYFFGVYDRMWKLITGGKEKGL